MIKIRDVARYYQGLPHQIQALELLDQELWANYPDLIDSNQDWVKTWRKPNPVAPKPDLGVRKINQAGLDLIKEFEGLELSAYLCPAGVWTIGYGHTGDVHPGDRITAQEAEGLLREDLDYFERQVSRLVRVPVTDNQYAALVSFCYNVGEGALADSTLLRLLNASDYAGALEQFMRWVNANGVPLPGLVRRRQAEKALFDRG
ncbi:MAG: lysozyme [Pseudanabaenaceae cyanobacterium bins.68]|nr:lysozyme [Pseudanabaenaceae cyanobacterium bins.68]